jgi:hypothetical protein
LAGTRANRRNRLRTEDVRQVETEGSQPAVMHPILFGAQPWNVAYYEVRHVGNPDAVLNPQTELFEQAFPISACRDRGVGRVLPSVFAVLCSPQTIKGSLNDRDNRVVRRVDRMRTPPGATTELRWRRSAS